MQTGPKGPIGTTDQSCRQINVKSHKPGPLFPIPEVSTNELFGDNQVWQDIAGAVNRFLESENVDDCELMIPGENNLLCFFRFNRKGKRLDCKDIRFSVDIPTSDEQRPSEEQKPSQDTNTILEENMRKLTSFISELSSGNVGLNTMVSHLVKIIFAGRLYDPYFAPTPEELSNIHNELSEILIRILILADWGFYDIQTKFTFLQTLMKLGFVPAQIDGMRLFSISDRENQ